MRTDDRTTFIGKRAEEVAADYLRAQGFTVFGQNWRQRDCEIDIVAGKDRVIYFVEVKYRSSDVAGSGLEYIGRDKLRRMAYAARRWVHAHNWSGEYVLSAIEVSDESFAVTGFIDSIDAW
jgi:putative endonuclease